MRSPPSPDWLVAREAAAAGLVEGPLNHRHRLHAVRPEDAEQLHSEALQQLRQQRLFVGVITPQLSGADPERPKAPARAIAVEPHVI